MIKIALKINVTLKQIPPLDVILKDCFQSAKSANILKDSEN